MPPALSAPADVASVRFDLPDPHGQVREALLWLDLGRCFEPAPMTAVPGGWTVQLARPPVQRLQYLFLLRLTDGSQTLVCDPTNPHRVATAFGEHSVLEFPGYRPPAWLTAEPPPGRRAEFRVDAAGLGGLLPVTIWSPPWAGCGERLPLLVLHDGPEFDRLASFTRFAAAMIEAGRLPPHRLALLGPGERNRWYAANPDYASALHRTMRMIGDTFATRGPSVLAGASLGALAALHAATTETGAVGGLFLQSGSFFRPSLDAQESDFGGFGAVTAFVESFDLAPPAAPLDIAMTAGLAEENLANNRQMAAALSRLGHRVVLAEVPDAHNYTCWRDALDPHLVDLLVAVWTR